MRKETISQFRICTSIIAFLLSLGLIACGTTKTSLSNVASEPAESQIANSSVESAERVVALTALTADIIYQLDKTKLVGMSGNRLFKEDNRFQKIPKVSEGQTQPNLEKIIALKPDLVIGAKGFSDPTLTKLKELGINTLSTNIDSWNALLDITQRVAQITAADPKLLLERYQTFLTDISEQNPSILILVSRQPILAPNKNSWAGDLLTQFKAKNVAADLQGNAPIGGYVTLSAEKILQQNPAILLIVDPGQEGLLKQFKSQPFWQELQATQKGKVYVFDYYGLVNPGSIDKIEETCTQLKKIINNEPLSLEGRSRLGNLF